MSSLYVLISVTDDGSLYKEPQIFGDVTEAKKEMKTQTIDFVKQHDGDIQLDEYFAYVIIDGITVCTWRIAKSNVA